MVTGLTDVVVIEVVGRPKDLFGKSLEKLLPPVLGTARRKSKLVVLRSQIGMIWIDKHVEVGSVLLLKLRNGHLVFLHLAHVFGQ